MNGTLRVWGQALGQIGSFVVRVFKALSALEGIATFTRRVSEGVLATFAASRSVRSVFRGVSRYSGSSGASLGGWGSYSRGSSGLGFGSGMAKLRDKWSRQEALREEAFEAREFIEEFLDRYPEVDATILKNLYKERGPTGVKSLTSLYHQAREQGLEHHRAWDRALGIVESDNALGYTGTTVPRNEAEWHAWLAHADLGGDEEEREVITFIKEYPTRARDVVAIGDYYGDLVVDVIADFTELRKTGMDAELAWRRAQDILDEADAERAHAVKMADSRA